MIVIFLYLLVGALAGLVAGLFGIGGGLIIVPALLFSFAAIGVDGSVAMQLAVGTSLATIVVTSISSVRAHHALGNVDWKLWRIMVPGIALGVWLGVNTAAGLDGERLKFIFGLFMQFIGVQMIFNIRPGGARQLPGLAGVTVAAGGIGYFSALFGIGGGSLTVPFLNWCSVRMQAAVATSAAVGLPIALIGALSNMWVGYDHADLPQHSLGFVYLPGFLGIVLTSTLFAKLGAQLAQRLPAQRLRRSFGVFTLLLGLQFIVGALV